MLFWNKAVLLFSLKGAQLVVLDIPRPVAGAVLVWLVGPASFRHLVGGRFLGSRMVPAAAARRHAMIIITMLVSISSMGPCFIFRTGQRRRRHGGTSALDRVVVVVVVELEQLLWLVWRTLVPVAGFVVLFVLTF